MRKVMVFFYGILLGFGVGVALVAMLSPVSGTAVRQDLREHYKAAMQSARRAAQDKRAELEAELTQAQATQTTEQATQTTEQATQTTEQATPITNKAANETR